MRHVWLDVGLWRVMRVVTRPCRAWILELNEDLVGLGGEVFLWRGWDLGWLQWGALELAVG